MTTELYFQLEIRKRRWAHFGLIRFPYDYRLFVLLGGIDAKNVDAKEIECFAPKGLPEDVTEQSLREESLTVNDEAARLEIPGTCFRADAESWVETRYARFIHNGNSVTHPDFHSHSWMTLDELYSIRQRYESWIPRQVRAVNSLPELNSVISLMESLLNDGIECRAVIWFED